MYAHHLPCLTLGSRGLGVLLPGGACTLMLTAFPVYPTTQEPTGSAASCGCRCCHHSVVWWRVEPLQCNYTFISPTRQVSQPASQAPLPLMLPISSLLCSPLFISPQRLLSPTISISTWYGSNSSPHYTFNPPPSPIYTPLSHYPTHQQWVQKEIHKEQKQSWSESGELEAKGMKMRGEVKGEKQHEMVWNEDSVRVVWEVFWMERVGGEWSNWLMMYWFGWAWGK